MKEELKINLSIPLFDTNEMINFESNINYIIEDYIEELLDKKEKVLIDKVILKQKQKIKILKGANDILIDQKFEYIKEIDRLNNIIKELEKSANEIVRVGKNKGYQYVENFNELKTKEEIYDFIEFYYGLYLLEQLDKLKELKGK